MQDPSDSDWIRITSSDGFSYIVRRKIANVSGTMRSSLDEHSSYAEAVTRTCHINERGIIVEKMLEYMAFKLHYQESAPKEDVPVNEYMERLPPEIVLELLVAADYQDGKLCAVIFLTEKSDLYFSTQFKLEPGDSGMPESPGEYTKEYLHHDIDLPIDVYGDLR
ncbi:hypothetical protein H0H92_005577 [Tricholoma furcatifolium]|nr:hypothetical protein H0H92_005577 [Tricholoma furcatifolium]